MAFLLARSPNRFEVSALHSAVKTLGPEFCPDTSEENLAGCLQHCPHRFMPQCVLMCTHLGQMFSKCGILSAGQLVSAHPLELLFGWFDDGDAEVMESELVVDNYLGSAL